MPFLNSNSNRNSNSRVDSFYLLDIISNSNNNYPYLDLLPPCHLLSKRSSEPLVLDLLLPCHLLPCHLLPDPSSEPLNPLVCLERLPLPRNTPRSIPLSSWMKKPRMISRISKVLALSLNQLLSSRRRLWPSLSLSMENQPYPAMASSIRPP